MAGLCREVFMCGEVHYEEAEQLVTTSRVNSHVGV